MLSPSTKASCGFPTPMPESPIIEHPAGSSPVNGAKNHHNTQQKEQKEKH